MKKKKKIIYQSKSNYKPSKVFPVLIQFCLYITLFPWRCLWENSLSCHEFQKSEKGCFLTELTRGDFTVLRKIYAKFQLKDWWESSSWSFFLFVFTKCKTALTWLTKLWWTWYLKCRKQIWNIMGVRDEVPHEVINTNTSRYSYEFKRHNRAITYLNGLTLVWKRAIEEGGDDGHERVDNVALKSSATVKRKNT